MYEPVDAGVDSCSSVTGVPGTACQVYTGGPQSSPPSCDGGDNLDWCFVLYYDPMDCEPDEPSPGRYKLRYNVAATCLGDYGPGPFEVSTESTSECFPLQLDFKFGAPVGVANDTVYDPCVCCGGEEITVRITD
jgi:hypothetical protein